MQYSEGGRAGKGEDPVVPYSSRGQGARSKLNPPGTWEDSVFGELSEHSPCLFSSPLLTRDWKKLSSPPLKPGERGFRRTFFGSLGGGVLGSGTWGELAKGGAPGKGLHALPVASCARTCRPQRKEQNVSLLEKAPAGERFHLGVRGPPADRGRSCKGDAGAEGL